MDIDEFTYTPPHSQILSGHDSKIDGGGIHTPLSMVGYAIWVSLSEKRGCTGNNVIEINPFSEILKGNPALGNHMM